MLDNVLVRHPDGWAVVLSNRSLHVTTYLQYWRRSARPMWNRQTRAKLKTGHSWTETLGVSKHLRVHPLLRKAVRTGNLVEFRDPFLGLSGFHSLLTT